MKGHRSYYYGQIVQGLEYNPRLFLYLLIVAAAAVYSYQFASQVTTQWMTAGLASLAMLACSAILTWPYQAVMASVGLSIWVEFFIRGQTMVGLGSALVFPGDLFIGTFMMLEFFRGCMRQTHLYTITDRWMLALYVWTLICVIRGLFAYGYSTFGEAREFLYIIAYFVTIHYVTRSGQTESVLKWLAWICAITGIVLWYRFYQFGFRPRFGGGHPLHFYGYQLSVILGVLLGRDQIKRFHGLATVALTLSLALALYGGVRSPQVALLATFPFLLWIARRHFAKALLLAVVAVVAFFGLVLVMDPVFGGKLVPGFEKAFEGIINPSQDPTGSWRLYGWRWEMNKIFSNPFWVLIGQGWGGYYEWYFGLTDPILRTAVHNQYITMWSKMGCVSLFLYAGVLIAFYRQTFRFLKESRNELHRSVIMIIMLLTFANQVHAVATGFIVTMWIQMALGTALSRLWLSEDRRPPIIRTTVSQRRDVLRESARFRSNSSPLASRRLQP